MRSTRARTISLAIFALILAGTSIGRAQQLGWEGSTGVFVTPLAYTAASPERKVALPTVAYHYLNGGSVLGTFSQISITSGFANRVEFGYTRTIHAAGSNAALSPLWTDGFNTFHGKGALLKENSWKKNGYRPFRWASTSAHRFGTSAVRS